MQELHELIGNLDMESYLDFMGIDYKHTSGSSGPQLNIKTCPSCGNSKWKVYMNEQTGLGNCFSGSCQMRTFNKWRFIKATLDEAPNNVVYKHLRDVSIELGWKPRKITAAVSYDASEIILPECIKMPDINGDVHPFLTGRGITPEISGYFNLAYCHEGYFNTKDADGKAKVMDFSEMIIIPIFDLNGNLVTFQGRDVTGKREPKYLFPSGLQSSGRFLYNGQNAIRAKHVVVGEGAFDVMAIQMALQAESAMRDIVPIGTFGMHLSHSLDGTASQLGSFLELKRMGLKTVTMMWDGEPKAIDAAMKAANKLRRIGLEALIALLPEGRDPNEVPPEVVREAVIGAYNPMLAADMQTIMRRVL
jgi:DNA primase